MATNSRCRKCGHSPCDCHTTCRTPSSCIPKTISKKRPKSPTVTIQSLLELIETKCDDDACKVFDEELGLLYLLLGIEDHRVDKLEKSIPGRLPSKLPDLAFQLISNMTDSLKDDVTGKYPSAELLKKELKKLWECVYNKQEHHGEWKDNFTTRTVNVEEDDLCALDGGVDTAPKTVKVITPIDVGSTVFNVIEGKRCLFESLVNNNVTEPTKKSVLEGKWLNYCDLKQVIDCVLPRKIITDCKEACDDPNKDGVFEGKTLCEQLSDVVTRLTTVEQWIKTH